jgi:hypothetical protein
MSGETPEKNLTTSDSPEIVRKAKAWERSQRSALALLDRDFHLGGTIIASRDELHER